MVCIDRFTQQAVSRVERAGRWLLSPAFMASRSARYPATTPIQTHCITFKPGLILFQIYFDLGLHASLVLMIEI